MLLTIFMVRCLLVDRESRIDHVIIWAGYVVGPISSPRGDTIL